MFGRLFGQTAPPQIKTIQLLNDESIEKYWKKLLVNIDLTISKYHDYNDIILISSPYLMKDISQSLNIELNTLNLVYISPLIIEYLFGNEKYIESKLQFITTINMLTIKQLLETMSIIIIDIHSSEMIKIPSFSTDLSVSNSVNNNHHQDSKYMDSISSRHWKIRWSTDKNTTSGNFQNIMNDICNQWKTDANIMQHFDIYTGRPPNQLTQSIHGLRRQIDQLEKREAHLDKKIQICLLRAKEKSKKRDKKGALFELKKKKQLEKQLQSIQGAKLNLETQTMSLETPIYHHRHEYGSDMIHDTMNDDELETELTELEELESDILIDLNEPELPYNASIAQQRTLPYQDEDEELAELEAMMN